MAHGRVQLWSRRGQDWTETFPEISAAARGLLIESALLDGEVAAVLPNGMTSFQVLQNALHHKHRAPLVYFVFDLLELNGESLRHAGLEERKQRLKLLLGSAQRPALRYSEHVVGHGREMFRHACELGAEGVVSKRRQSLYRGGRTSDWVKTKCIHVQELVVGGFTDPEGSREGIGALLVGVVTTDVIEIHFHRDRAGTG